MRDGPKREAQIDGTRSTRRVRPNRAARNAPTAIISTSAICQSKTGEPTTCLAMYSLALACSGATAPTMAPAALTMLVEAPSALSMK